MDQSRSEIGEGSSIRQDLTVAVKVAYANIAIFSAGDIKKPPFGVKTAANFNDS